MRMLTESKIVLKNMSMFSVYFCFFELVLCTSIDIIADYTNFAIKDKYVHNLQ